MNTEYTAHVELYLDRQDAIGICSDMGKEAYGVRPRWINFSAMTLAEINSETDHFADVIEQDRFDREECERLEMLECEQRAQANAYKPNQAMALALASAQQS